MVNEVPNNQTPERKVSNRKEKGRFGRLMHRTFTATQAS